MHRKPSWIAVLLLAVGTGAAANVPAPFVEGQPFPTMALPSMGLWLTTWGPAPGNQRSANAPLFSSSMPSLSRKSYFTPA